MFTFPKHFIDSLIGDDYSWWEQVISEKKVSFEFMKYLSENASSGISIVRKAIQNGLDENTIKKFVQKEFDFYQMSEIYEGFLLGKDYFHMVEIFCNPEFSPEQMHKLKWCITAGCTLEQLKSIAKPELSPEQMDKKRKEFRYINQKNRLSDCLSKLT